MEEFEILFSWMKRLIQPRNETSWLQECIGAIQYRGGPRNELDEAYLKVAQSNVDLNALTRIIHERQMEVANGIFGIHSGAYNFSSDVMPDIRFTIHASRGGEARERADSKELPNAIDDFFIQYMSENP